MLNNKIIGVMQTILIPTDFTIESLGLLKMTLQEYPHEQLNIVLAHGTIQSDSIQELLFHSPARLIAGLQGSDFKEACAVIQNKFSSQIRSIRTVLFTGKTHTAFANLLEANRVDAVVLADHYTFKFASRKSIELTPYLRSCSVRKLSMEWEARPISPEKDKLAEIFAL